MRQALNWYTSPIYHCPSYAEQISHSIQTTIYLLSIVRKYNFISNWKSAHTLHYSIRCCVSKHYHYLHNFWTVIYAVYALDLLLLIISWEWTMRAIQLFPLKTIFIGGTIMSAVRRRGPPAVALSVCWALFGKLSSSEPIGNEMHCFYVHCGAHQRHPTRKTETCRQWQQTLDALAIAKYLAVACV